MAGAGTASTPTRALGGDGPCRAPSAARLVTGANEAEDDVKFYDSLAFMCLLR